MKNGSCVVRLCAIMMYQISSDWRSATFKVLNKKNEVMYLCNKWLKAILRQPGQMQHAWQKRYKSFAKAYFTYHTGGLISWQNVLWVSMYVIFHIDMAF